MPAVIKVHPKSHAALLVYTDVVAPDGRNFATPFPDADKALWFAQEKGITIENLDDVLTFLRDRQLTPGEWKKAEREGKLREAG